MNFFDNSQKLWIKYNSGSIVNIVFNPTSDNLIKLDFQDLDGQSVGTNGIGLHPSFALTDLTGSISNPHDTTNIPKVKLNFSIASNKIISVVIPNAINYFLKSSYPYVLIIFYKGVAYNYNFYIQLTNNGNRIVCTHNMSPSQTLFTSSGVTNIPVNTDTKLANISLRTTDGNLFNYFINVSKVFSLTFSPIDSLSNPNFNIVPDAIDGTYYLTVFSNKKFILILTY